MTTTFRGWTYNSIGKLVKPNGKLCNTKPNSSGYRRASCDGVRKYQHQVIFFLHNGYWADEIDHADRDKLNNAPSNLVDTTHSMNNHNKVIRKGSVSDIKGVFFDKRKRIKPWRATIVINGVHQQDYFDTKQQAIDQRELWEGAVS